jgi:hypothetical protein
MSNELITTIMRHPHYWRLKDRNAISLPALAELAGVSPWIISDRMKNLRITAFDHPLMSQQAVTLLEGVAILKDTVRNAHRFCKKTRKLDKGKPGPKWEGYLPADHPYYTN